MVTTGLLTPWATVMPLPLDNDDALMLPSMSYSPKYSWPGLPFTVTLSNALMIATFFHNLMAAEPFAVFIPRITGRKQLLSQHIIVE